MRWPSRRRYVVTLGCLARMRLSGALSASCTTSTTSDGPIRVTTRSGAARSCGRGGYPEYMIQAILSHADYSGVARESRLEHALFACDEMAGFATAASLVRPSKSILDLEARSVKKRMKDKAFARAVSRDDLRRGSAEINLPLDEHITHVILFMREHAAVLGLQGGL